MSYMADLRRRAPDRAASRAFLVAQRDAFRLLLANPRGRSDFELEPIRAAVAGIEAALPAQGPCDKAAVLERARARAKELGICVGA